MTSPRRVKVAVLTYHSLDDSGSVLATAPRIFAAQMRVLHDLGVRVATLSEVRRWLGETTPRDERLVAITFDDGFRSVYEHALPVLQRYGFAATTFLVTDYCGRTNSWPSQPASIERRPLLSWAEVREMSAAGMVFASHTRTHPDLTGADPGQLEDELVTSKKAIEDGAGRPVDAFAYPYGVYDDRVRQRVRAHFHLACSTALGFATPASDPFALPRLDMYYLRRPALFRRLFSRELDAYLRVRRTLRDLRAARARGYR